MALNKVELNEIRRLPFFAKLPMRTLVRLVRGAAIHHFGPSSILYREGGTVDYLHVVLDGFVAVQASDGRGNETVIEFVSVGAPFPVAGPLLGKPNVMTAHVMQPSRILMIPTADVRRLAESDFAVAKALNERMMVAWRELIGQVKSLKMQTGPQRLAGFLLSLARARAGEAVVELPCERRVIAAWLGMVPTSGSRAFRALEKLGVEGHGRKLRIRSVERLAQYVGAAF